MMNWHPEDLVEWKGARLLSRPEMELRQVKGVETPQRFGNARFSVEYLGEVRNIRIGSAYWDEAKTRFEEIQGDRVDVIFLPYPWAACGRSGIAYFYYKIEES